MEVELLKAFLKFSLGTFKKATVFSSLEKCREEILEIENEVSIMAQANGHGNRGNLLEEYTDAIMCLVDSAARAGFSADDLRNSFQSKLIKNMARKWRKNPDDTYSHVKD